MYFSGPPEGKFIAVDYNTNRRPNLELYIPSYNYLRPVEYRRTGWARRAERKRRKKKPLNLVFGPVKPETPPSGVRAQMSKKPVSYTPRRWYRYRQSKASFPWRLQTREKRIEGRINKRDRQVHLKLSKQSRKKKSNCWRLSENKT